MNKDKLFLNAISLLIEDMSKLDNCSYSDIYKMLYEKYIKLKEINE